MAVSKRKRRKADVGITQTRESTIHLSAYLIGLIHTNRFNVGQLGEFRTVFQCAAKECTKALNAIGRPNRGGV